MIDSEELRITQNEENMIRSCEFFDVKFAGTTRRTLKKMYACLAKKYKKRCPFPDKQCLIRR